MSLTTNEKERAEAAAVARSLDILADECLMIAKESVIRRMNPHFKECFMALHDNLAARAKDYKAEAEPQRAKGGVLTI